MAKTTNKGLNMDLPVNYQNCSTKQRKLVREEYCKIQNNLCYFCGNPLSDGPTKKVMDLYIDESLFPNGFFRNPIHLHHDHNTGMTLGSVHCVCNAILWQYYNQ